MKIIVIGILTGLISGAIAALCGVGGGLVMVPVFTLVLGLGQKQAVATSLAVIVPVAFISTAKYMQQGLIHWPLFGATALGGVIATWFMADRLKSMQDNTLTRLFAAVLILMGILLWFKEDFAKATPEAPAKANANSIPDDQP